MNYEPLNFDYEILQGQRVISIRGRGSLLCSDGSTTFEEIRILSENSELTVSVNDDTDELVICLKEINGVTVRDGEVEILQHFVDENLGWCWVARNWLGYADTFILSFDGLEPQILLCGIASMVNIYDIKKVITR